MRTLIQRLAFGVALLAIALPASAQRRDGDLEPFDDSVQESYLRPVPLVERNLSGPRIGFTYVTGGRLREILTENGVGNFVSQFGWHFERQVSPIGGGPAFVIETIPLIAAVEYGKVAPSVTLAMGLRFSSGWEFGLGPSLMLTGTGKDEDNPLQSSLVMAVGRTIDYGGVSVPLNLALSHSPDGARVSFVFGYALTRSKTRHGGF